MEISRVMRRPRWLGGRINKELVEHVIKTGRTSKGNGSTTVFKGNDIRSNVDNKSGNVVTVTKV